MSVEHELTDPRGVGAGGLQQEGIRPTLPLTIIVPTNGWRALDLQELWRYRELLYFLTWRDVKVRYKQTAIGAAWAVLQPFLTMVVFSIIFGGLAHLPSDGVPYPAFSYAGLLPWTFFATAISQASVSLVNNTNMIQKVYFPRVMMPAASVAAAVLDLAVAFVVLLGMTLYFGIHPTVRLVVLPLLVLLAVLAALGVSLWLAAINVKYRDVRYAIPFLTQIWMFATPVAYPSSLIPARLRVLYGLNPMAGVVEGFRWALLGTEQIPVGLTLVSAAMIVTVLAGGLLYFRRMEREFADVI